MAEQGFEPVADGHLAHLRFVHDRDRHVDVGAVVDEDVTHAGVVGDHRDRRLGHHLADETGSTTGDHEVDRVVQLKHHVDRRAIGRGQDRDRVLRNAFVASRRAQLGPQRLVRMERLAPAAQDHGVARLEAERRRVDRHVRSRFVDHRDHAERDRHLSDAQTVGAHAVVRDPADRIGQRDHVVQALDHVRPFSVRDPEPVSHRVGHALLGGLGDVLRVRLHDLWASGVEPLSHAGEPGVLALGGQLAHQRARGRGARGEVADLLGQCVVRLGHGGDSRQGGSRGISLSG